jgi:hypothetical protein
MESHLVKTKNDTDYPDYVMSVCSTLRDAYGFSARITDLWSMLLTVLSLDEFELMDYRLNQNGKFYSYLLDSCIQWREGKPVDFRDIYDAILINGDFSKSEKSLFEGCDILDILWAIFIVVNNPGINFN